MALSTIPPGFEPPATSRASLTSSNNRISETDDRKLPCL